MTTPAEQAARVSARLRERRMNAWREYRDISDKAAADGRPFTPGERAQCDLLQQEMAKLDVQIMSGSATGSFFDADNNLLAQVPVRLDTGTLGGGGEPLRGVLTWRTASTTLTAVAAGPDMKVWGDIISELADHVIANDKGEDSPAAGQAVMDGALAIAFPGSFPDDEDDSGEASPAPDGVS